MVGIVVDGLVAAGEKGRLQRIEVKAKSAGFGSEVYFETGRHKDFKWMQRLCEEEAGLVAAWIDGAVVAGNRDNCLTRKTLRHGNSTYLGTRFKAWLRPLRIP